MQYMFLIYTDPALTPNLGSGMNDAYTAFNRIVSEAGALRGGDALHPSNTATSVRVRGDKVETMDGPFAETKEALAGYYILDCKDLDEALHYAALIPGAKLGTVEVRPIYKFN